MQSRAPSTGIGRAGKWLGMLTGYRLKKKKMNPALCMRALLLSQKWLHQMNSTFSYSFLAFVSFFSFFIIIFILFYYIYFMII